MRRAGFTLIELLVVISLMTILTVMALQASTKSERDFAFNSAYNEILQTIRGARALSVSNDTVTDSNFDYDQDGQTGDPVFPYGYGVRIEAGPPAKMIVFTDMPTGTDQYIYDKNNDKTLKEITIDERFELDLDVAGQQTPDLVIYYEPPYGFPNFSQYGGGVDLFRINLRDNQTNNFKRIIIHPVGGVPELDFKNS